VAAPATLSARGRELPLSYLVQGKRSTGG